MDVTLVQHALRHNTPDAVFPNNWFSTHAATESDGSTGKRTMVLYPMKCPNRAAERRPELVELIKVRPRALYADCTQQNNDQNQSSRLW